MLCYLQYIDSLAKGTFSTGGIRIQATKHLLVKINGTNDCSVIDQLLRTHTSSSNHSQPSILKLFRLHVGKVLGIGRLQTQRIKSNISRVVTIPQLPQSFGPVPEIRLHPSNSSALQFRRANGNCEESKGRRGHLLKLIVGRTSNSQRTREGFSHEVSDAGDHGDAAVHQLGFAVALDFVEGDSRLGEAQRIEVAGGCDGAGKAVAFEAFVGYPAVDGCYCWCRLGNVGGDFFDGGNCCFLDDVFIWCGEES